ncbi:hypothetical protein [Zestomonas carbonaria]|uniref:Uncharacterized protein n=1 Tax=Zestomonas carbonaria TaxID=2762745 RepID=A0A7U7IB50_9GAMM|nr:hypothetical protein [Pseudomonas carbonaria]CAD5109886.1 hypothetical protein PSEWESI4_04202 [Pseudomonas carbonaria]
MKTTVPFWSVDEFLYWFMPGRESFVCSSEGVSRVSGFLDAYILYDQVVLPERYKGEGVIRALDPSEDVFEFVTSDSLVNSDSLAQGLTVDFSLDYSNFSDLQKDEFKWFSQHLGYASKADYESIREGAISFTLLRLWQISLVSEIAELTDSTVILPLSLQGIDTSVTKVVPFHVKKLDELNSHFQGTIRSISMVEGNIFSDYIKNVPPFLALLIDQAPSREYAIETLVQFRRDYGALRQQSVSFCREFQSASTLRNKKLVVDEWNTLWDTLLKGDFQKPVLLRRKVSSADMVKAIVDPSISLGVSAFIKAFLEYRIETKAYSKFRVYSDLYNELDVISGTRDKLRDKFLVDFANVLDG